MLRLDNITKSFPGVLANDRISLDVREGEILALLGENGAGKTTLMNCLYGQLKPDAGQIYWRGRPMEIPDSHAAVSLGIGMVHQHFMLVPVLSVVENVSLGLASTRGLLLDLEYIETRLNTLSREFGLEVNPRAVIWRLPVGAQQRVEILKALYREIQLLILDEPTAVLTPGEVNDLFAVLRRLSARGVSVILITHKLEEVMAISDRVTVLRDGRVVETVKTSDTTPHELAHLMVGREVIFDVHKPPLKQGKIALEVQNIKAVGERGALALNNISFSLHEGEILGFAGVDGNGQQELEEVLCGLRRIREGQVFLHGQEVSHYKPDQLHQLGLAHIPSDRLDRAVAVKLTVEENMVASHISKPPYSRRGILNPKAIRQFVQHSISTFNIQTPSPRAAVATLSGGNQQRVVLASALGHQPRVLIAAQPTRGLDVGLTQQVYERLVQERSRGAAILLISTELQEIFRLSDRIAVMYRGELMGIAPVEKTNVNQIGMMMAGVRLEQQEDSLP
ncbi:MAG: ABC transporter ATP-binding protein [Anaerolineaceae bacterium]|nr:ABC transporter ATP-binding protein [Anaerolineaceae bacterium]